MTDEFTEIARTRISRRTRQRADMLAEGDAIEATRLGSRAAARAAGASEAPGAGTDAAAPSIPVPARPLPPVLPAVPVLPASRVASVPVAPGEAGAAARERYGARPAAAVVPTRAEQAAPHRTAAPVADVASFATLARDRRTRARRRALWTAAAILAILLLVTAGILLVTSALGR